MKIRNVSAQSLVSSLSGLGRETEILVLHSAESYNVDSILEVGEWGQAIALGEPLKVPFVLSMLPAAGGTGLGRVRPGGVRPHLIINTCTIMNTNYQCYSNPSSRFVIVTVISSHYSLAPFFPHPSPFPNHPLRPLFYFLIVS